MEIEVGLLGRDGWSKFELVEISISIVNGQTGLVNVSHAKLGLDIQSDSDSIRWSELGLAKVQ